MRNSRQTTDQPSLRFYERTFAYRQRPTRLLVGRFCVWKSGANPCDTNSSDFVLADQEKEFTIYRWQSFVNIAQTSALILESFVMFDYRFPLIDCKKKTTYVAK